ncbi:MAG: DUF2304 family protein [Candidatus Altiarchaeota archaeon]
MIDVMTLAGILFSLFALSRVFLRLRDGRISPGMFLFWTISWVTVILFLLFTDQFEVLSKAVGIDRPLDFILVVSVLGAYYLTFRVYVYLEELRVDLAKIVRELAISREKEGD